MAHIVAKAEEREKKELNKAPPLLPPRWRISKNNDAKILISDLPLYSKLPPALWSILFDLISDAYPSVYGALLWHWTSPTMKMLLLVAAAGFIGCRLRHFSK